MGLTAPCDVGGGIKVSYVNGIQISMLRRHRHLQMLQMFERKHTNRVTSNDYFQPLFGVGIN